MPLSENEQRLLEQMEKALAAEDPKFASALQGRPSLVGNRFAGLAIGFMLLGVIAIVAGVAIPLMPVGLLGFVGLLAGVLLLTSPKSAGGKRALPNKPVTKVDFMKRFEQRWDDRNLDGN